MKAYNPVQNDRQWIRRILREEKTLIDAFNDTPPNQIFNYPPSHQSNRYDTVSSTPFLFTIPDRSKSTANKKQSSQSKRSHISQ